MTWLLLFIACKPPSEVPFSPSAPSEPGSGPAAEPLGDRLEQPLTVNPLLMGFTAALVVRDREPGDAVQVWVGSFGGTTCPPTLDQCLPIGDAEVAVEGLANAEGTFAAPWPVPMDEGRYPVFLATVDGTVASLPVMRRIWAETPHQPYPRGFFGPTDPFDEPTESLFADPEPPLSLPPGDWFDLSLEGRGDRYVLETRGGEGFVFASWFVAQTDIEADFHPAGAMLRRGGPEDSDVTWFQPLEPGRWGQSWHGRSLADFAWSWDVFEEYGEFGGYYDVSWRIEPPEEPRTWFVDADADGYGDASRPMVDTRAPAGTVWRAGDCDDTASSIHPDAWDVCNDDVDTDCSGTDKPCRAAPAGDGPIRRFSAQQHYLGDGRNPSYVAAMGDTDGDGLRELWARQHGWAWKIDVAPGAQHEAVGVPVPGGWGDMAVGDFDGDGIQDVAYAGDTLFETGGVAISRTPVDLGDVDGAWARLHGAGAESLQVVHTQGEPRDELLVRGESSVWIVRAPVGERELSSVAVAELTSSVERVLGADLDGDGTDDLVAWLDDGTIALHRRPWTGPRTARADADALVSPLSRGGVMAVGDASGDGVPDLLTVSWDGIGAASTARLVLGPLFEPEPAILAIDSDRVLEQATLVDLTGDGVDDLVLVSEGTLDGRIYVVHGPVSGAVSLPDDADAILDRAGTRALGQSLWALDADDDGGTDLVHVDYAHTLDVLFGVPR